MENPVLEPRAERIARYKAERRRELAERYGVVEELPLKWTKRDREGRENEEGHRGMVNSESAPVLTDRLHHRSRAVANGLEADDAGFHRRIMDNVEEEDSKDDVKTDERAKMSVAAKMSLFKELEKSAPASSHLKPRSGSVNHERRSRRNNDHRFMTQPITCEEMGALSSSKPVPKFAGEPEPTDPDPEDESCKMSMSEKLALFNKLSLPEKMAGGPAESAPDRRRQKGARYRTQPITVEEVSLLQKGPVQLPAFSLAPHLSDRQQALSINLKPSEVRRSQPKLDPSAECFSTQVSNLPRTDSEPALRSILKKSRSGEVNSSRTSYNQNDTPVIPEQNGGDRNASVRKEERREAEEETIPQQRASVDGPSPGRVPWRQRGRGWGETIACTPMRNETDQEVTDRHNSSPVQNGHDTNVTNRETAQREHKHHDSSTFPKHINSDKTQDDLNITQVDSSETPKSWSNHSFEAQEVASPAQNTARPLWRKKESEEESGDVEAEVTNAQITVESPLDRPRDKKDADFESGLPKDIAESAEVKDTSCEPRPSDAGFHGSQHSPLPCVPPPRADSDATDSQDLFCQTNIPILTSSVAEHRRSIRPSRRTQGSRNPLRALAAREDIQQDLMGESAEERLQAQQKAKNCSSTHSQASCCEDVSSVSCIPCKNHMLILIKGRRHVQVRLVEPSVRSLNSGDCYLLVSPEHCIVWTGEFASEQEKAKAFELSTLVQSQKDLGCKASHVVHLEEGLNCESASASDFWSLLGGRTQYRGASALEEDEEFEVGVIESNCVYRLVEDKLVPHEEAWACAPAVSLLDSNEALVCDFGSEVYLWEGQGVSQTRRDVALQLAQQVWAGPYDYSNCQVNPLDPTQSNPTVQQMGEGRPGWALFSVMSQNNETCLFREKFQNWMRSEAKIAPVPETPVRVEPEQQSSPADHFHPCDAKALVSGQSVEGDALVHSVLSGVNIQRGHGVISLDKGRQMELNTLAVDTWLVQEFDDTEFPVESTGQLHERQSYVVRWTYTFNCSDEANCLESVLKENTAFFLWRGRHSSVTGRDTAAFLSIGTNHQEAAQVVVPQGREPPCFLQLFKGGLVIHKGTREEATSRTGDWRLFVVRGELPEEASLTEVDCCCAGLRSRGSVILLNSQQRAAYQWTGCKAQASTREVSRRTVERLTQISPPELGLSRNDPLKVQMVDEGSEPPEFWAAVGNMDRKAYDCMLQDPGKYNFTPRLFHLSASSGDFKAEEFHSPSRMPGVVMAMPFVQEVLYSVPQPALFLLDNRLEVYLWQRGQADHTDAAAWSRWQNEQRCAMQTALQYCKEMNPRRPPQSYLISEGTEPLTFTNVFPNWDRSLGPQTQGDMGRVKLILVQDALAQLMKTQGPLEELCYRSLPEGVDPQHLEVYLSDQDFQTLLEMKRDEKASLPGSRAN